MRFSSHTALNSSISVAHTRTRLARDERGVSVMIESSTTSFSVPFEAW